MSHWVLLTLGNVDSTLDQAWEAHKNLSKKEWIAKTANEIEKLGNINPTNGGFILAKEEPTPSGDGRQKMDAVVLPRSVDWELHEHLNQHKLLLALKDQNIERFEEVQEECHRKLRTLLIRELRHLVDSCVEECVPKA